MRNYQRHNLVGEPLPVYDVAWTTVNDIRVLRIGDSRYVAAPNGKRFDIIDIEAGKFICQVRQSEVSRSLIARV